MNRDLLLKFFTIRNTLLFSLIVSSLNVVWEISSYGLNFDFTIYLKQFAATYVIAIIVFMCIYMLLALLIGNLNLRK